MSRSPVLGAVSYNVEAAWAEASGGVFGTRLPMIGAVDVTGLKQAMLVPDRTTQLRNEITQGVPGVFGGSFKTKFMLTGHGSTAAGILVLNALETLLGIVIGNVVASRATGAMTATAGGSVTALNVSLANGTLAGALIRCGLLADTRGNGQFALTTTHATSIITLLTAIDGILNNGDAIYNPAMVYPTENPVGTNDITSTRWLLQTANIVFECRGCYPKAITIAGLNPAEEPSVEIEWGVSVFTPVNTPLVNATAVQTFAHAPVANGSLFLNTFGNSARVKYSIRSFQLTYQLGIAEQMGPGGLSTNQVVVGCKRIRDNISVEFTIDADNTTATPDFLTKWKALTPFQLLYTISVADGSAMAICAPFIIPDGDAPTQLAQKGLNAAKFRARCGSDNSKATDLERSALRIALA